MKVQAIGIAIAIAATGSASFANTRTAEGPSEAFAMAQAQREVPKGATVIDSSCKDISVGMSTRFRCTMTYSE